MLTEIIHLFLARELVETESRLEPTEVLEVHWVPLAEAVEWTRQGKITDAKTVIGLLRTFDLTAQGTP